MYSEAKSYYTIVGLNNATRRFRDNVLVRDNPFTDEKFALSVKRANEIFLAFTTISQDAKVIFLERIEM
jgi:hypothetical protein